MISDAEWAELSITRMIFHVVRKSAPQPVLLSSIVPHDGYEEFFLERVRDTTKGAAYTFNEIAGTKEALKKAAGDDDAFVAESRNLASRFQALFENDKRLSDGVLLLMELKTENQKFFDLIKFDHDPGVRYDLRNQDGQFVATLASISNQFSKRKEAMQKSALISLGRGDEEDRVMAIDKSGRPDMTAPFQSFLDVRRLLTNAEVTNRLCNALYDVGRKHQKTLAPEVLKGLRNRAKNTLEKVGQYDPEKLDELKAAVYGALDDKHPIHAALTAELDRKKISNEPVNIDPDGLPKTRRHYKETVEGIQIFSPPEAEERISVSQLDGGEEQITIRTQGIKEDDVEFKRFS